MRNQRGYTLIEILVVLAIIGILAGIAIQSYAGDRQTAQDAKVVSALRNLALRQEAYFATHREYAADLGSLGDLGEAMLDDFVIALSAGNTGSIFTSFHITITSTEAAHTYTWVSDPVPGEPNLTARANGAAEVSSQ